MGQGKRQREHPGCPACGYDLAGAVATWQEACPLHGACPECGGHFLWRDVLSPAHRPAPWFIEQRGDPVKRWRKTLVRSFFPWRFWSIVRPGWPLRMERAAASMIASSVILWISSVAVLLLLLALANTLNPGAVLFDRVFSFFGDVVPYGNTAPLRSEHVFFGPRRMSTAGEFIFAAFMPLAFAAMGPMVVARRDRAFVWSGHAVRLVAYALPPLVVFAALPIAVDRVIQVGIAASTHSWGQRMIHPFIRLYNFWTRDTWAWPWTSIIALAWLTLWWWAAFRWYVRVQAPAVRAALLAGMVAALGIALAAL